MSEIYTSQIFHSGEEIDAALGKAVSALQPSDATSLKSTIFNGLGDAALSMNAMNDTLGFVGYNLLPNTAESTEISGVTFTVNEDKSVTLNGTALANIEFDIYTGPLVDGITDYKPRLTGCPSGGSDSTYSINLAVGDDLYLTHTGGDPVAVVTTPSANNFRCYIKVITGVILNNVIFKPMVCYNKPNREVGENLPYYPHLPSLFEQIKTLREEVNQLREMINNG